jgi:mono/diheme cytochrome c family protein
MRAWILLASIAALTACASHPGEDRRGATVADISAGRMIAENNCAACHAVGMTGNSPLRAAPPFRILSERHPIRDLEDALAEGIATGHPSMPEWILEPSEINELLGYIQSIQTK